jgi:hypothetical protein
MNERIQELAVKAKLMAEEDINRQISYNTELKAFAEKFAELILANADELKREVSTDPINKPFQLNPKFVAKCDEIGRSRRQFQ